MVRAFYIICFLVCIVAGALIFALEPLYAMALVLTAYVGARSIEGIGKN